MSANLSLNIQHRVSLKRNVEAMLMDFLSIYEVGSVFRIEDFDALDLKSSLIKTQLDLLFGNGKLARKEVRFCNACDEVCLEGTCAFCGDVMGTTIDPIFSYLMIEEIEKSSDSDWNHLEVEFPNEVTIYTSSGNKLKQKGVVLEDEIRLLKWELQKDESIEWIQFQNSMFFPKRKPIFRPSFGSEKRHYSIEVFKKENFVMNNINIGGNVSNSTINQDVKQSEVSDNILEILDLFQRAAISNGNLGHEIVMEIEKIKKSPKESLVTRCKDFAATIQTVLTIFGSSGPALYHKLETAIRALI